jgi:hypothetical protein
VVGVILFRFTLEAVSANSQREGDSQESWLRPALPFSAKTPPLRMTWHMTDTTSRGAVWSEDFTNAETSRPRAFEATPSA